MQMENEIGLIPGQWPCMVCGADKCWPARPPAVIGAINLGARSPTPSHEVLRLMFPWLFLVAVPHLWSLVGLFLPRVLPSSLGW